MTIAKLREAVKVAEELTSGVPSDVYLSLCSQGVLVRATRGHWASNWLIGWDQLEQSNINPLLPAIKIVIEGVQETLNAE